MATRPELVGDSSRVALARELRESGAFQPRLVKTVGPIEDKLGSLNKPGLTETRGNDPTRNPLPAAPILSRSIVGKSLGK